VQQIRDHVAGLPKLFAKPATNFCPIASATQASKDLPLIPPVTSVSVRSKKTSRPDIGRLVCDLGLTKSSGLLPKSLLHTWFNSGDMLLSLFFFHYLRMAAGQIQWGPVTVR